LIVPPKPSISLVIPMFNEEANIEHALGFAVEGLETYSEDYEIIVVDDASTDRSSMLVDQAAAANRRIRVIRHDYNLKLGNSLRAGLPRPARISSSIWTPTSLLTLMFWAGRSALFM